MEEAAADSTEDDSTAAATTTPSGSLGFVELYSPIAQPFNFIFYLLGVVCMISVLDRLLPLIFSMEIYILPLSIQLMI